MKTTPARKGTARTRAQATNASSASNNHNQPAQETANLDLESLGDEIKRLDNQRLFRKGRVYHLVTSDDGDTLGATIHEMTRDQVRAWLDKTIIEKMIPLEFRRDFRHRSDAGTSAEHLSLGEILGSCELRRLAKLAAEGAPVVAQVAGAIMSWLNYAEHLLANLPSGREFVNQAPGILDCDHYDYVLARQRSQFISESGARFYRALIQRAQQLPLLEASAYLRDLSQMIEHHPALADERETIESLGEQLCQLGKSPALTDRK